MSLIEVHVYENDRNVAGWGSRLPTDRPQFSDATGVVSATKSLVDSSLPKGCTWRSDWALIDDRRRFDDDGWQYAFDFPREYSNAPSPLLCVRRRIWRRVLVTPEDPATGEPVEPNFPPWFAKLIGGRGDEESYDAINQEKAKLESLREKVALNAKLDDMRSDEKVDACTDCGTTFTFVTRRHRCRACVRQFCHKCCDFKPDYGNVRVCNLCVQQHIKDAAEAEKKIVEQASRKKELKRFKYMSKKVLQAECNHEANQRCLIRDSEAVTWFDLTTDFERELKELHELQDAELATFLGNLKAEELLDMWHSYEGSRNGVLTLCVVGAADVPTPGRVPASTMVRVVCGEKVRSSEFIPKSRDPKYDFNVKLNVEDDLAPIELLVYLHGGSDDVLVAGCELYLHSKVIQGALKRHVSAGTHVYYEEGFLQLPMVNIRRAVEDPTDTSLPTITVRYTFEVREKDKEAVDFCPECGRLPANCVCDDSVRVAREAAELNKKRETIAKMHRAKRIRRERAQGFDVSSKVREWEMASKGVILEYSEGMLSIFEEERAAFLSLRDKLMESMEAHSTALNKEAAVTLVIRGMRHAREQQAQFLPTIVRESEVDDDGGLHVVEESKAPSSLFAALRSRFVHDATPERQYEDHMSKWLMFAKWRLSAKLGRLEKLSQRIRMESDKEERVCRDGMRQIVTFLEGQKASRARELRQDQNKALSVPNVSEDAVDVGESTLWTRKPFPVPASYAEGQLGTRITGQSEAKEASRSSCCIIQ